MNKSRTIYVVLFSLFISPIFTQTPSYYIATCLKYISQPSKVQVDTLNLDTIFAQSGNIYLYGNGGGGYVFGNNRFGNAVGFTHLSQKQLNPLALNKPTEILIAFGAKKAFSGNGVLKIYLSGLQPGGSTGGSLPNGTYPVEGPGATIGDTILLPFASIDTNSSGLQFTVVPVSNIYSLVGNFYVTLDLQDLYQQMDTIGIWADANGDGILGAHGKYQNKWYQVNTIYQNQLNVNMAVFAIVQDNVSVGQEYEKANILLNSFAEGNWLWLKSPFSVPIRAYVVDLSGRLIKHFVLAPMQTGLDISNLPAGSYYLLLESSLGNTGCKFTKP